MSVVTGELSFSSLIFSIAEFNWKLNEKFVMKRLRMNSVCELNKKQMNIDFDFGTVYCVFSIFMLTFSIFIIFSCVLHMLFLIFFYFSFSHYFYSTHILLTQSCLYSFALIYKSIISFSLFFNEWNEMKCWSIKTNIFFCCRFFYDSFLNFFLS